MIRTKRVYDAPVEADGTRFLVDHLWPRGLKKREIKVATWLKAVSPSNELRRWFKHDPARWKEFKHRYFEELDQKPEAWQPLQGAARKGAVTLVYSARDEGHNNAVALKDYLKPRLKAKTPRRQPRLTHANL